MGKDVEFKEFILEDEILLSLCPQSKVSSCGPDSVYFDVLSPQSELNDWRSLNEMVDILTKDYDQENFSFMREAFTSLATEISEDYKSDSSFEPQALDILQYNTEKYIADVMRLHGQIVEFVLQRYDIPPDARCGYSRGNTYYGLDNGFRWSPTSKVAFIVGIFLWEV